MTESLLERQYATAKATAEKMSPSDIDVRLSTYGVNGVLRDEILERLSELAKLRADVCPHCGINKVRAEPAADF